MRAAIELNDSPYKVFVAYSRKDAALKDALVCALASLVHEGRITILHDVDIGVGENWREEIRRYIWEADVVLLLISADFIASEHCGIEAETALELDDLNGCIVVPVVGRPCVWNRVRYASRALGDLHGGSTAEEPLLHDHGQPNDRALKRFVEKLRHDLAAVRPRHLLEHAERILNFKEVIAALSKELPTAERLAIVARTGMGWFRDLEEPFEKLPPDFTLQLLALDPESDAFEIDTALSWKPMEQKNSESEWATSRSKRTASALEFQQRLSGKENVSLRVTPVPILYSLLAIFPNDGSAATVFAEIPIKMMNKGANRYLSVAPENCDQYVAWIEKLWDAARPWTQSVA